MYSSSRGEQLIYYFTAYNLVNGSTQILVLVKYATGKVYQKIASGHLYQNDTKLSCSSVIHFENTNRAIRSTRRQSTLKRIFLLLMIQCCIWFSSIQRSLKNHCQLIHESFYVWYCFIWISVKWKWGWRA